MDQKSLKRDYQGRFSNNWPNRASCFLNFTWSTVEGRLLCINDFHGARRYQKIFNNLQYDVE